MFDYVLVRVLHLGRPDTSSAWFVVLNVIKYFSFTKKKKTKTHQVSQSCVYFLTPHDKMKYLLVTSSSFACQEGTTFPECFFFNLEIH